MMKAVKQLTWLNFVNFLGINEARYAKDGKKKRQLLILGVAYLLLGSMLVFYAGMMTYGLILFGMREIIPVYLVTVISLLGFLFSVFRAGPWLFSNKAYEMLIVLPVPPAAIIISRFLTLYITDMIISVLSTVSVVAVCLMTGGFGVWFYISMILGSFILPLLPMTVAMLIGTGIYAITARMRQKNLMQILFSVTFLVLYFTLIRNMNGTDEELMGDITEMMLAIKGIYLPASWFGDGVWGNIPMYLLFVGISVGVFSAFAYIASKIFKTVCSSLSSHSAKRNYVMKKQKSVSVFRACFLREIKRYFSYPLYVMNTLVGFVMVILMPILLVFGQNDAISLILTSEIIVLLAPFFIGMIVNTSPITTSAFSIEGKEFWLIQSLPIQVKDIIHSKLALNLIFAVPSVWVASTIITIPLRPSLPYLLWLYIIPTIYAVFGSVLGLWVNMKAPVMTWDNIAQIVKQSKAVLFMMLIGFASAVIPLVAVVIPYLYQLHLIQYILMVAVTLLLSLLTFLMYRSLLRVDLQTLSEK